MDRNINSDLSVQLQLDGYRLTTVEILYYMPDHPHLLQMYIWQDFDLPPKFPRLFHFLDFWNREIEGPIHSVRVGSVPIIQPAVARTVSLLIH